MRTFLTIIFLNSLLIAFGQTKKVQLDTLGNDSIVRVFHANGQLFFQVPYKNGMQNGWYEQYHENGTIWLKELRINGNTIDGYNVVFHDNGIVYQTGYFKNGHQVGKWNCYSAEGKPFKIYIYNRKGIWTKLKVWNAEKTKWEKSELY